MKNFIHFLLVSTLIYVIASFIGGTFDLLKWHWVLKLFFVLIILSLSYSEKK